ncbi:GNAT family N-acetyltransferase [Streptococcus suis]|uniref:GNAT family N-acetyltransferase n=1 Tax=Streptococcus suis TaxID=1307 RepID=UPI00375785B8
MLVKADLSNAEELLPIQHRAFAALYETYQDQYNPAIETMDYFQSRFARPNCTYYKIVEEGHTVGLVRTTVAEDADQGWLGLIGIDPDHRGKGYGHKAMLDLEQLYPTDKRWGVGKNSTEQKGVRLPTPAQLIRSDLECKTRTNPPINHCAEMLTRTLRNGSGLRKEPRLVAFYEKLGYKAIKTEPEQEGMDMVYMEKWIGDSDV